jgi:hypothetical protein
MVLAFGPGTGQPTLASLKAHFTTGEGTRNRYLALVFGSN